MNWKKENSERNIEKKIEPIAKPKPDYSEKIKKMEKQMRLYEENKNGMKVILSYKNKNVDDIVRKFDEYSNSFWKSKDYGEKERNYLAAEKIARGNPDSK